MSAPMTLPQAMLMPCPQARAFEPKAVEAVMKPGRSDGFCIADKCPVWRWRPLMVDEPGYKEAVAKAEKDGMKPADAARHVSKHRKEYGLHDAPYLGWCGLGGGPTT